MALFSRRSHDPEPAETHDTSRAEDDGDVSDTGRPIRPEVSAPSEADRARIRAALEDLDRDGVDVDDLASVTEAYARAVATGVGSDVVTERFGLGIGEHLVRHGAMDWRVVTDVFGTDLGVTARRRDVSVIPTNIVATRYLRGETDWIPGVVGHLIRLGRG